MGANYSHTSRVGSVSESEYNLDHQNHIDNGIPSILDDYSANVAEMQATADPGEVGTESLSTSLAGELERLRHLIKEITGKTEWYESPANSIAGLQTIMPTGGILAYAATGTPSGFLECNGQNVSRSTYSGLFTAIGVTWGSAATDTFTVPDLRRRAMVGKGGTGTGTLGNAVGNTGGAETVNLAHGHTVSGSTGARQDGAPNIEVVAGGGGTYAHTHALSFTTATSGSTTQTIMQPSAVVGYFIKT